MARERDLQTFIEQNVGKKFGDKYIFGNILLDTRFCRNTQPELVEITLNLPWASFSECLDIHKISDNIEFYKWLNEKFVPLAQASSTEK